MVKEQRKFQLDRPASEEAVLRARQAEIFPKCRALVFAPKDAAPLQFRHNRIDEIVGVRRGRRET
jgi:hypothetical protein